MSRSYDEYSKEYLVKRIEELEEQNEKLRAVKDVPRHDLKWEEYSGKGGYRCNKCEKFWLGPAYPGLILGIIREECECQPTLSKSEGDM